MSTGQNIAFIGTGIMGSHMARRLAEANYSVCAWNRTAEKLEPLKAFGVNAAESLSEAGSNADIAIVMVSDGPASDNVVLGSQDDGLISFMREGSIILVMSSIPAETAANQAQAAADRAIDYLDAPVSGGEPGARDGKLVIMAGGDGSTFNRLTEVLSVFGRATLVGPAGAGSLAKIANQIIVGNTISTVAEALLLVQQGGADPLAVIEAMKGGFADSPILQNHGRRMIEGDFKPGGKSRIQLKDMRTAEKKAQDLGLELPLTSLVREIYESLVADGLGELDHAASYLDLLKRNRLKRSDMFQFLEQNGI